VAGGYQFFLQEDNKSVIIQKNNSKNKCSKTNTMHMTMWREKWGMNYSLSDFATQYPDHVDLQRCTDWVLFGCECDFCAIVFIFS